ncbi:RAP domain-containing protein [Endozoicomonas sp. GU-1]|uniref:RAP domain-containing protein n=1 Tax=Endozoicomonas sp. GU-1 TaxID=3009078 RepID=UPI0022B4D3FA|nr:RAP domain-containing protein [Endozoicomonas sp. GU-1]WBA85074.1 DUF1601 domain-containing protein [Endozoicomonas sp. GU-1]
MDIGGSGISWKYTTSGNDYKRPDDNAGASGSGQYRYGTVRQVSAPFPYIIQMHNTCHTASDACSANHPPGHSIKPVHGFNALITPEKMDWLVRVSARYGDHYDGKKHSQFACSIKQYTSGAKRLLNQSEQCQLIPLLHDFKVTSGWTWRSLTTTLHSLTSAGVLTPYEHMNKGVSETQAALLSNLLDAVIHTCNQKPETWDIDAQGAANLLWALVKLVDNGLDLHKTAKLKEAVVALLPHVQTKAEAKGEKDHFIPQHIAILLRAMAKLVDNGLKLEKTPKLKETVVALLPHVTTNADSKKGHFNAQGTANLLWAVAKLVDSGLKLKKTPKLKEAVAALLYQVTTKANSKQEEDLFNPQEVTNLLWAVTKLVDNGLELEKTPKLKEAVVALLPHVKTKAEAKEEKDQFNTQGIANLLWALAKLVDYGLELKKTAQLKEALAALLPYVKTKAEAKEEKDHFKPQGVANLLWAVAKLVDNGLELEKTPKLKEAVAALLPYVKSKAEAKEEKDGFKPQGVANLLWAVAKLVDSGLELEKTPKLKEAVAALLPHVKSKAEAKEEKGRLKAQAIVNLLWAVAKLVDNGLELEKTPKLKETVTTLLPHVKSKAESEKGYFIPQHLANLLWALAKLVDNGLELEKTPKLKEVVIVLLPYVTTKAESKKEKDHFKPQEVANLLWAVVKLVGNGLELEKTAKLKEALAALLYHVKTKVEAKEERSQFTTQGTVNLLWALAKLGEAIEPNLIKSTFDFLVDRISKNPQLSEQNISLSLWGVMVFCARVYLDSGRNNKNPLEKHIGELFVRLGNTATDNIEAQTVIAMAASWLGRACPVVPHYRIVISEPQSAFRDQLQASLPSLTIEEEKSLNSLPPVDLLLPDYNTVIAVQGPSHYVSGDFNTRNGSTLLKIALLQKLGFEVIEIPVNKIDNQESMKMVIEQVKAKLAILPEAHDSVSLNSGEWAADEAYFTADDGGQFSDDCYFTAEEYSEEQTGKPKRKRKRKKLVKTQLHKH